MTTALPARVTIREVGLRDGLQSIKTILPTERKREWIRDAYAAGQREIEVGSFVPAHLLPQLADTGELVAYAKTLPGLFVSVLVPNLKGAQRAIETGADLLLVPLSASHAHSLANLRKTPDEVVAEVAKIRAARDAAGRRTLIEGGVGTAFGCTLQGRVEPAEVLRLMQALLDAGADRVSLADTVGYADPRMVRDLFEDAVRLPATASGAATSTTRAALRWPTCTRRSRSAWRASTPRSPASAAARTRRARAATRPPRTSPTCSRAWISIPASTSPGSSRCARKWQSWLAGETLHGTLWRAGLPKTSHSAEASRRSA